MNKAATVCALAALAIVLGLPSTAAALPLLSEVFYDAVGSDDGRSFVELYAPPGADLIGSFDFQNGPDSIVLRSGETVLDALGYGVFAAGEIFAGEGAAAPDAPAGSSLARRFANADSGDNSSDFVVLDAPTPGIAPLLPVPEPGTAALVAGGLLGLGGAGRRARRRC